MEESMWLLQRKISSGVYEPIACGTLKDIMNVWRQVGSLGETWMYSRIGRISK